MFFNYSWNVNTILRHLILEEHSSTQKVLLTKVKSQNITKVLKNIGMIKLFLAFLTCTYLSQ